MLEQRREEHAGRIDAADNDRHDHEQQQDHQPTLMLARCYSCVVSICNRVRHRLSQLSVAARFLASDTAGAIARDPAVLMLDEATSALDSDTERTIFANLKDWLERRTVVVMAHRLATISRFRHVSMLASGAIIAEGSVTRLLATCPAFAEMFADQLTPVDQERESKLG
jgi:ABC-type methionine transport system ATPase subunit